ncbi:MAG TPA: phosphoglycolate phosphatase [Bauldia sp.]|nr:phosphoglycolate phosphatase [Bauldia sp.]
MRPTLVLDLDGTLVDTASDLVATLNAVLAGESVPPIAYDEAVAMVGHGARSMLAAALKSAGEPADEARLDRLFAAYLAHYADHLADTSRAFPGVAEALDRFTAEGWTLAVCTNKLEGLSKSLLSALGLADRFAVIAGQDTFAARKPDPLHLLETVRAAGGSRERAVMVGDSIVDIETARAAGIPVVGVDFGYSAIPVRELGPDAVVSGYDALFDAATALLAARRTG